MESTPGASPPWIRRELSDLLLLVSGVALIPAAWWLVMGWSPGSLLMAHDGKESLFTTLRDLLDQGGAWTSNLYTPAMLGGVPVHDVMGTPPLYRVCAALGLSAVGALDAGAMFVQLMVGFLTARTFVDLVRVWSGGREAGRAESLGVLVMGAFAPALAWRLGHGHLMLGCGVLAFAAGAALMTASLEGSFTITLVAVAVLAMTHAFSTAGHQLVIYGALFGLPFFGAMAWRARSVTRVGVPLLCVVSALGITAPRWSGMVAHALGTDASRALGGPSVIFSYATSCARDWLSCVTWAHELIPTGRNVQLFHELNYPAGPLLLLLVLMPWRRFRGPLLGLLAGLSAAIYFTMDLPGVASFLTALCPPIASFRCPQRALLPFALLLPAVAVAALAARDPGCEEKHKTPWAGALLGGLMGAATLALTPAVREVLMWLAAAAAVGARSRPGPRAACVIFLTAGCLGAFRERLLPFVPRDAVLETPQRVGRILREAVPGLESCLERIRMDYQLTVFQVSSAPAMRLSTLDGYWNPPRRFLALGASLLEVPEDNLVNFVAMELHDARFRILRQLYNVRWNVIRVNGFTRLAGLGPTAGPAWFSAGVRAVPDLADIGAHLRASGEETCKVAHQVVLIAGKDPKSVGALPALLAAPPASGCVVREVRAPLGQATVQIDVTTPAQAPLTVAMNYTERLGAHAVSGDGTRTPLLTFPAYGALLGIVVPAGTTRVLVEPEPFLPAWARVMEVMGWMLLVLATFLALRVPHSRPAGEKQDLAREAGG